jgi:hypothetical protein
MTSTTQLSEQGKKDYMTVFHHIVKGMGDNTNHYILTCHLIELTEEQLSAFVEEIKDGARINDLCHDLNGIANREICFVPRLRKIDAVTEFIS